MKYRSTRHYFSKKNKCRNITLKISGSELTGSPDITPCSPPPTPSPPLLQFPVLMIESMSIVVCSSNFNTIRSNEKRCETIIHKQTKNK